MIENDWKALKNLVEIDCKTKELLKVIENHLSICWRYSTKLKYWRKGLKPTKAVGETIL